MDELCDSILKLINVIPILDEIASIWIVGQGWGWMWGYVWLVMRGGGRWL